MTNKQHEIMRDGDALYHQALRLIALNIQAFMNGQPYLGGRDQMLDDLRNIEFLVEVKKKDR